MPYLDLLQDPSLLFHKALFGSFVMPYLAALWGHIWICSAALFGSFIHGRFTKEKKIGSIQSIEYSRSSILQKKKIIDDVHPDTFRKFKGFAA